MTTDIDKRTKRLTSAGVEPEPTWKGCCNTLIVVTVPCDICQTPSCARCLAPPVRSLVDGRFICPRCAKNGEVPTCVMCRRINQAEEHLLEQSSLVFCRHGGGTECRIKALLIARHEQTDATRAQ